MAILFNEVDDHYTVAVDASLDFPDGDWCVGMWTRVDDNSGSDFQYALSDGPFNGTSSFNLYLYETSRANGDKWYLNTEDDGGSNVSFLSSSTPGGDGVDRLIIAQRRAADSEIQMYFCEFGGTAVKEGSASYASYGARTNSNALHIGARYGTPPDADRYYGGILGEVFKGDFSLSAEEITALGGGLPILSLGKPLDMYHQFRSIGDLKDVVGANDATSVNAGTTAEHFPIILPWAANVVQFTPAAGGETVLLGLAAAAWTGFGVQFNEVVGLSPAAVPWTGRNVTVLANETVLLTAAGQFWTGLNVAVQVAADNTRARRFLANINRMMGRR